MEKYSFWVHLLLEGELEPGKEAEVFEALAKHPELREEFRHLVLMNRSLREQPVRMPPPTVTRTVFDRLFRGKRSITSPLLTFGGGILVGLLLSGIVWFTGQWSQISSSVQIGEAVPELPVVEFTAPAQALPVVADTADLSVPVSVVEQGRTIENEKQEVPSQKPAEQETPIVEAVSVASVPLPSSSLSQQPVGVVLPESPSLGLWSLSPSIRWDRFYGEYREKVAMIANPQTQRFSDPLMRQFQLTLGYQLTPNHAVGIAVGRESFPQRFYLFAHMETDEEREEYDVRVYYEQVPILWWAGGFYRAQWELMPRVSPFAEAFVGGTRVGPLLRATLGTSLWLTDNVALQVGVEGSTLLYQVYERVFATQKMSLVYGLKVGL